MLHISPSLSLAKFIWSKPLQTSPPPMTLSANNDDTVEPMRLEASYNHMVNSLGASQYVAEGRNSAEECPPRPDSRPQSVGGSISGGQLSIKKLEITFDEAKPMSELELKDMTESTVNLPDCPDGAPVKEWQGGSPRKDLPAEGAQDDDDNEKLRKPLRPIRPTIIRSHTKIQPTAQKSDTEATVSPVLLPQTNQRPSLSSLPILSPPVSVHTFPSPKPRSRDLFSAPTDPQEQIHFAAEEKQFSTSPTLARSDLSISRKGNLQKLSTQPLGIQSNLAVASSNPCPNPLSSTTSSTPLQTPKRPSNPPHSILLGNNKDKSELHVNAKPEIKAEGQLSQVQLKPNSRVDHNESETSEPKCLQNIKLLPKPKPKPRPITLTSPGFKEEIERTPLISENSSVNKQPSNQSVTQDTQETRDENIILSGLHPLTELKNTEIPAPQRPSCHGNPPPRPTTATPVRKSTTFGDKHSLPSDCANMETGLTGVLQFNGDGRRDNFSLTITSVTGSDTYLRGHWFNRPYVLDRRLKFYDEKHSFNRTTPFPLKGRTAKVVMIEERPFTMKKRDHMLKRGNARFEGFAVDLIDEVAKMLEFDYEIYLVNDGKFGSKMPNGEWNGMIGELLSGNATMSVAPLSINAQREEAVDFTKPFKTRYISVIMRIPRRETSYFEFLNPLSPIVWICTLIAFVLVSIVLYILERMGRNKCVQSDSVPITVRESFWFIFGSLLQGNTDSTPSTIPGRILTSAWWFFALILISSYTANLAAFLTVKKINTPIKSVTDLAQQTKIKYGTVKDSGIMSFFKNTNIEHFAKMWSQMSDIDPDSMVDNTTEGYKKVKEGDYAFFWDTTVNKYQTIIDCDVMEIGPAFDPKGFGIGVPPGATYREELSMAILKLSDRGRLHEIETKWWDSRSCPDLTKASTDETSSLQIENVAGVFFILVGGIAIAAVVCLGEYFANAMIRASKLAVGKKVTDKYSPRHSSSNNGPPEKDSLM